MKMEQGITNLSLYKKNNKDESKNGETEKSSLREAVLHFFEKNGAETGPLKEYWSFLEESREDSEQGAYSDREKISNMEDAREQIESLLTAGIKPIISIPKEYIKEIEGRNGISAQETDIKNVKLIAGVIGDVPYKYNDDNRVFYEVDCSPQDISPRLTGQSGYFNGVVVWNKDFIPLENIRKIEKSSLFSQAA